MPTDSMIHAEGLRKHYGSTVALAGVDLEVPAGAHPRDARAERCRQDDGRAHPDDPDPARRRAGPAWPATTSSPRPAEVRRNIGVTAQDATLDEMLTGRQNLVMVGRLSGLRRDAAKARAHELLGAVRPGRGGRPGAEGLLGRHAPAPRPRRRPRHRARPCSSSTSRPPASTPRAGCACGASSADSSPRASPLLLTTQYLDEADELADRIVVVDHGRVIAEGTAGGAEDEDRRGPPRGDPARRRSGGGRRPRALRRRPDPGEPRRPPAQGAGEQRRRTGDDDRARPRRGRYQRRRRRDAPAFPRRRVLRPHRRGAARSRRPTQDEAEPPLDAREVALHDDRSRRPHVAPSGLTGPASAPVGKRQQHRRAHRAQPASTSPASPCSSPTSPSSPCSSRCCSSTSSAPASPSPAGAATPDFAIAGMLALNLTTSAMGTAVGLSNDLNSGIIDRFRTLPMWRPAVLVGRSVTDLLTAAMCAFFVCVTGLCRRLAARRRSVLSTVAGFAIFLLFSYAVCWACACLGIVSKGPESAQGLGFVVLFPLAFVSNALVPTARMPGRCCARSPTGTRSAPSRPPAASSSATPTRRPPCTPGRCSTRSPPRCSGRSG